jgi:spore maturation protein CgeB
MNILYIGSNGGTTLHRKKALERLGYDVLLVDPKSFLSPSRYLAKWIHDTGAWGLENYIKKKILNKIYNKNFDIGFIDGGYLIGPGLLDSLKENVKYLINYNVDDPFSKPEWMKWRIFRKAIPYYDLHAVVRVQNINEVKNAGAKKVIHVFRSADEIEHKPISLSNKDFEKWSSEIVFVGTWFPERGPFFSKLIKSGVPISIWGDRWYKAKEWPIIKNAWRGPGIFSEDYVKPLLAAKICLGLLSKGNRDLHTQRSLEIPALGSLFFAERTSEHLEMYEDGVEAVFWSDPEECIKLCFELLKDPNRCDEIAGLGHVRSIKNNYFNEPIMRKIISHAKLDVNDEF